ncbi:acetoin utilization protein AcuC [Gemmobacter sp.]|uniref:acetoin utilization protein AcuC n=1 Tax=Gemmobacter sp. TaxID=1898957 RepID=UPI002AFFA6A0|nr:acetoin utilization protein AcuC [Gemmobacter sp.]
MGPVLIGHEIYRQSSYGQRHPLRVPRVSTVMDLTRAMGWLPRAAFRRSPRARPEALTHWHHPAYIAALQEAEEFGPSEHLRRFGLGTPANPVFPEVWRRPATSAGGVMLAAELLREGGVVYAPAGGTHHGLPDRANGFCYLNDPVLAMLAMRRLGIQRIAYVDIDAHHCDGVDLAFRDDPDILLLSVHEERRWPFTGALEDRGAGNVFNLPVPAGFNDSEMRAVLYELILPRVESFGAQAVVLQCGADAVDEDPLSRLALSNNAHWQVVRALQGIAPRYLVLGGGGYNPWSVGRCWAGVWATLTGAEIPDHLPPEAEAVLRGLVWHDAPKRKPIQPHWFTTLRDAPREGEVRPEIRARLAALAARPQP